MSVRLCIGVHYFGHEATTMVAIGPEHLERGNHAALETHHLALVRVARVPTDGEVTTLPTIWRLARLLFKRVLWHVKLQAQDRSNRQLNRPAT